MQSFEHALLQFSVLLLLLPRQERSVRKLLYLLLLKIRSLFNKVINRHIFHIQDVSFFFISVQSAFLRCLENLKGALYITEIRVKQVIADLFPNIFSLKDAILSVHSF